MPKDYVFQRNQHGDPDTHANSVRIGWQRDGEYLEVMSFSIDKSLRVCQFENGKWIPVHDLVEQGFATHIESRRDINRFIAILKRARDQAFGKDE